jgi:hypothetical protein
LSGISKFASTYEHKKNHSWKLKLAQSMTRIQSIFCYYKLRLLKITVMNFLCSTHETNFFCFLVKARKTLYTNPPVCFSNHSALFLLASGCFLNFTFAFIFILIYFIQQFYLLGECMDMSVWNVPYKSHLSYSAKHFLY